MCKRTHASCIRGTRLVLGFFSFRCSHLNLLLLKMKCFHSLGRFERAACSGSLSVCGVMRQNCDEPLGNWVFFVVAREVEECQESPQRMQGLSGQTLSLFFPPSLSLHCLCLCFSQSQRRLCSRKCTCAFFFFARPLISLSVALDVRTIVQF